MITATHIVQRFTDRRVFNEPLRLDDLAIFVWQEFAECPSRAVLTNSWTMIQLLAHQQVKDVAGSALPVGTLIGPPINAYSAQRSEGK